MYLKHLSILGFRGAGPHLDLPLDHRTIIYGPNGSGKSSVLQSIAWSIYGKLPALTGGVFTREDALVNDFLDEAKAEVSLTLSNGQTITRTRSKQGATTRGANPLTVNFETDDAQFAIEQLIGLNLEEFSAAVFLHQETIRDFLTTTPDKRSATIDRMIGTFMLRSLIKVIDPKVPAEAIERAEEGISQFDRQLSQASVISREVIQKRKEEYGDPATLPQFLDDIQKEFAPVAEKLGVTPEATIAGLDSSLVSARQAQLNKVGVLENQAGQLEALKERHEQAAVTSWQMIRQRKDQYGDPADLPKVLKEIQQDLIPIVQKLALSIPQNTVSDLEKSLSTVRRAQQL